MKWLRMYRLLVLASLRSRMQYKFNFWFSSFMAALINLVEFAMLAIILLKFGHIKGWSLAEAGYLYAILTLSKAIYRTVASDVHHLEKYLVSGDLDSLLLRPVPVLLGLMSFNVSFRIGETIQGIAVLAVSMQALFAAGQLNWTSIPLTGMVILSGSLLLFGIGLLTATAGFWLTRIEELQNITEDAARTAVQYPLSIYPKWMQGLLLTVIPVAFANYVPSLYILRGEGGLWLLLSAFAAAMVVFGAGLFMWRVGISRYQSTGS
ncbi:ABC transporter permease [Paenibacillus nasutitermitis]|uniref:ABC transporter permease n=1 Tax=Paenibacillus nasutitermitis TaxID=1652958 RepID=A0A917DZ03_9BACL|nr:ABC-2 family transporter protein [Paenibacillus nasutitermitis]GGD80472.1 ABC transporter permease [Paenibacillus nasutitermitis]